MNKRLVNISIHLVVWFVLLSLPGFFRPAGPPKYGEHGFGIIDDIFVTHRLVNAVFLVILFYTNCYLVIPKFYLAKRYALLLLYIIGTIVAFVSINYVVMNFGFARKAPESLFRFLGPSHNLLLFIIVYVFSFALSLYNQWIKVKEEKLHTEILFLRAQINPHFLFNTLNSIYSLAITKSDKTAAAVVKLSGLMRYSITESDKPLVPLSSELDYINNYIELQKMRLSEKVKLNYIIKGHSTGVTIAPFLLIPFIENAFKYGVNAEEDSDIHILISISDTEISLDVINNKVYVQKSAEDNTGLGISNTKQRLKLLYPGKHQLVITDNDDKFNIHLKVIFN
ncbi:MAG: sensor histidine kinase [Bacteroidetes bacterium]|nr:sensor histidine kinase [Bacteroidota bacterium]